MKTTYQTAFFVALTLPFSALALNPPQKIMSRRAFGLVGGAAAVGGLAILWKSQQSEPPLFTPQPGSLSDKTILITGASTGLGLESAKRLAVGGAEVILTARNDSKGQSAVQKVLEYLKEKNIDNTKISYQVLDLDDLSQVKTAASWNIPKIDVLMNNAGIMALPERELTKDGFEKQMQSNHLGHFVLTSILAPKLTTKARIINVSSEAHKIAGKGLLFDYLWKGEPDYGPWKSYGQSKLANIFFTQELQRRSNAAGRSWTAVSLHPGAVGTDLGRNLFGPDKWDELKQGKANFLTTTLARTLNFFVKTVEQGATTQIYLAAGKGGDVQSQYFIDCKPVVLGDFARNEAAAKQLWEESERLGGIDFNMAKLLATSAVGAE